MKCRYRTARPEERDPIQERIVETEEYDSGVQIKVNGVAVAVFYNGDDHLVTLAACTRTTGLRADSGGYLLTQ